MKKIKQFFFPEKSKWFDISCFECEGTYRLIQMRYRLDNNKKQFRIAKIGFVNDPSQKSGIYNRSFCPQ